MPAIGIIGAGASGLACAHARMRDGDAVTLLERSPRPGGSIGSFAEDGFLAEHGPHSLQINAPAVEALVNEVPGLAASAAEPDPAAQKRYVVRDGRPVAVPSGPLDFLRSPLFSNRAKLRLLREPWIPRGDPETEESVGAFVRRRLGDEIERYAVNPFVGGIYSGRPDRLSVRHAFPRLAEMEREHGSLVRGGIAAKRQKRKAQRDPRSPAFRKRMVAFKNGMRELPEAIASELGDRLRLNVSVESIERDGDGWRVRWREGDGGANETRFDELVLAVPAHAVLGLPLPESARDCLRPLHGVEHPPVSVLSLGVRRDAVDHPLDGFGMLVPACEQRDVLGVIFASSLFPGRAPDGHVLLGCFAGGARQPDRAEWNDERLLEAVLRDLREILGVRDTPRFVRRCHWPRAIPQYGLGHGTLLKALDAAEASHPGLRFLGNYRGGIALPACLENGARA